LKLEVNAVPLQSILKAAAAQGGLCWTTVSRLICSNEHEEIFATFVGAIIAQFRPSTSTARIEFMDATHQAMILAPAIASSGLFTNPVITNVENNQPFTQKPIEIYVSCPWSKRGQSTVPMQHDKRWAFLRALIKKVIDECHMRVRASTGEYKPDIRLHRLRGRQGMNLLSTLRDRIGRADALIMDLAGHNANVLIRSGNGSGDAERRIGRSNHLKAKERIVAQQSSGDSLLQLR
jgi:hypothetical protein